MDEYSLFACLPVTGRTNQIRIHLAAIGHWILGDKMYHENENVFIEFYESGFTPWVQEQVIFPRHMLHNTAIMLDEKINFAPLSFKPIICPIAEDMSEFHVVQKLMKNANISLNTEEQIKNLTDIFIELHRFDFKIENIFNP